MIMVGLNSTKLGQASLKKLVYLITSAVICLSVGLCSIVNADTVNQSGGIGLEGTIPSAPPSRGATISVPTNGQSYTSQPITVSGICPTGLLIKIFDNNVFVGSTICTNGNFSLQIDLFSGANSLTAIDYDSLSQAGPTSNSVTINFNNAQFLQFGPQLTLSSSYAEKGTAPGTQLTWPILLSGGTNPYAISVDWGDGSGSTLISRSETGTFNITHTYSNSGVYEVIVKATDKNGETAYLQLVSQATGAIQHNDKSGNGSNQVVQVKVLWWPALLIIPVALLSFWLGYNYGTSKYRKYF
jgi:hypothetical protein